MHSRVGRGVKGAHVRACLCVCLCVWGGGVKGGGTRREGGSRMCEYEGPLRVGLLPE